MRQTVQKDDPQSTGESQERQERQFLSKYLTLILVESKRI